jgi:hypothetical protein
MQFLVWRLGVKTLATTVLCGVETLATTVLWGVIGRAVARLGRAMPQVPPKLRNGGLTGTLIAATVTPGAAAVAAVAVVATVVVAVVAAVAVAGEASASASEAVVLAAVPEKVAVATAEVS